MIEVEKLRKEFGRITAVADVSFTARPGEIFGLLGPNGAGKTTTIHCISGLLKPTSGTARLLGRDVVTDGKAARASLGVVPQEIALYTDLSARENLRYWAGAQGLRGADLKRKEVETLELVGLSDRARDRVKDFSGGMKRRLNLACGIIHQPKVLLLDEPTVGVDPQSRFRLLDLVRQQANEGVCVLYTTHYMEEAEQLCDRLGVIDGGRIIAMGSLEELRSRMGERDLLRLSCRFGEGTVQPALEGIEGLEVVQADGEQLTLALAHASQRLPELFAALQGAGAEIRDTTLSRPSLESLFIKLTGKELRE